MLSNEQSTLVRLLRWSEKYTKTDMVYLASGGFWLSGSSIITAGVSFGLALAFANLMTKDDYGHYKYILTIFGVLCVACLRGMDTVIGQAAARGNDGTVIPGLLSKMRWSLLGSAGAIAVAAYYFEGGNTSVALALLLGAFFIPFMEPLGVFNAVLVGKKDFRLSSLLGVAGQVAAAMALISALFFTSNPVTIFVVYCAVWTITRLISLLVTLSKYPIRAGFEPGAFTYARHLSVINGTSVIIASVEAVLVYHYLGAAPLAAYAFAMAPVVHARSILESLYTMALPKLASQTSANIEKILYRRTGILFLIGIMITGTYCLLAYPFYHIFFPQYIDAVPYSQAFSLVLLFQMTNAFVGATIDSRVTLIPKRMLYLWNIPGIVLAVSAIFLIQSLGLWGAIIGQLLSIGSSAAIAWLMWFTIRTKEHTTTERPLS